MRKKTIRFSAGALRRDPSLQYVFDNRGQTDQARRPRRVSAKDIEAGEAALAVEAEEKNEETNENRIEKSA